MLIIVGAIIIVIGLFIPSGFLEFSHQVSHFLHIILADEVSPPHFLLLEQPSASHVPSEHCVGIAHLVLLGLIVVLVLQELVFNVVKAIVVVILLVLFLPAILVLICFILFLLAVARTHILARLALLP